MSDRAQDKDPTPAPKGITRKRLLRAAAVLPVPLALSAAAPSESAADSAEAGAGGSVRLNPTPQCDDGDGPTIPQTEGPYFTPNSPERGSIVDGPGTALDVSGYVFGLACQPIANALLDFWQADAYGGYDNVGYDFRGHQYSGADGSFQLTTVVPGLYPGRTRHIHVKVQAPGEPVLTTQLYFPGEPRNNTDAIFHPSLLMDVRQVGGGREGSFDFVLNVEGDDEPPTEPPEGDWEPGVAYAVGDQVGHGGADYACVIAHTSMSGWEPPNTPALWRRL